MTLSKNKKKASGRRRFERLEVRIRRDQKEFFEWAASLEGQTLTQFVIRCVAREAERIVRNNEVIKLSGRDAEIFVEALLNPPPPNEALREAFELHTKITGSAH